MNLRKYDHILFKENLDKLEDKKLLINTLNAYSFVAASYDESFQSALLKSDILLPDGVSITMALKFLKGIETKKIAGADIFEWEMKRLQIKKGKCFFLGSSQATLSKIVKRCQKDYPDVEVE